MKMNPGKWSWPFGRDSEYVVPGEAEQALRRAREVRAMSEHKASRAIAVAHLLRVQREENHFADRVRASFTSGVS